MGFVPEKKEYKKYHCMFDIETMSTAQNACILTIGAVLFDPKQTDLFDYVFLDKTYVLNELSDRCFYEKITIESNDEIGNIIDDATLTWWAKESIKNPKAVEELFDVTGRISLSDALKKLYVFANKCELFWANSPNFDAVILENAASKLKLGVPWQYYQLRDVRTVFSMYEPKKVESTAHNALYDVIHQAAGLQDVFKKYNLTIKK